MNNQEATMKTIIEISKECGAQVSLLFLKGRTVFIEFTEAQLIATIEAVNRQNSEPVAYLLRIDCEGDIYKHIPCKDESAVWVAIKDFIADNKDEADAQHYINYVLDGENWSGDCCHYGHYEIGSWTLYKLNCELFTAPQQPQTVKDALEKAANISKNSGELCCSDFHKKYGDVTTEEAIRALIDQPAEQPAQPSQDFSGTLAVALEALAWASGHLPKEQVIERAIESVKNALQSKPAKG